jgi:hypothetical protein
LEESQHDNPSSESSGLSSSGINIERKCDKSKQNKLKNKIGAWRELGTHTNMQTFRSSKSGHIQHTWTMMHPAYEHKMQNICVLEIKIT